MTGPGPRRGRGQEAGPASAAGPRPEAAVRAPSAPPAASAAGPGRTRGRRRALAAGSVAAVLLPVLAAAGCASGPAQRYGADPAKVGPQTAVPGDQLPTAAASGVYDPAATATPGGGGRPSAPGGGAGSARAATDAALVRLTARLSAAVERGGHPPAHLRTAFSAHAGNQLSVTWTVSSALADRGARDRARRDALAVLGAVRDSSFAYGSVVLTVQGAVRDVYGGLSQTKVVRAKYSRGLVRATDFALLPPAQVFAICDDKAAEIHPSFR
ncbi:hypothetical protein [Streptomyces sp. NPDC001380]|uniref:hypothetical protein n=1 Tax=Streptomyces sp. NPDC001380 TaxID=3364566 RepID=UPI0036C680E9